jgi:hypothetical protein
MFRKMKHRMIGLIAAMSAVVNLPIEPENAQHRSRGLTITDSTEHRKRNRSSGKYRPAYLGVDANTPIGLAEWRERNRQRNLWNQMSKAQRKQIVADAARQQAA